MAAQTQPYRDILSQTERLSTEDMMELIVALAAQVRRRLAERGTEESILELDGLGAHVWTDEHGQVIDAQAYVDQERASWDG
ncbi:MAG TPA: hypothetical protein VFE42_34100 [Chloroflexota bacterium]|nr:hypothetical protein [Chloroflexota bacterium]